MCLAALVTPGGCRASDVQQTYSSSDVPHQPSFDTGAFWRTPYSPSVMPLSRGSYVEGPRTIEGGGMQWVVREAAWTSPGGQVRACLIFENEAVIRSVRVFPADWRTLPEAELYAVSLLF
jgi:hypothetical protein